MGVKVRLTDRTVELASRGWFYRVCRRRSMFLSVSTCVSSIQA
jgi:hypothetical protein